MIAKLQSLYVSATPQVFACIVVPHSEVSVVEYEDLRDETAKRDRRMRHEDEKLDAR